MHVRNPDGGSSPGLVVEQRPTAGGWRVLVVVVGTDAHGARSVTVRWVDASDVQPARMSHSPGDGNRTWSSGDPILGRQRGPGADR